MINGLGVNMDHRLSVTDTADFENQARSDSPEGPIVVERIYLGHLGKLRLAKGWRDWWCSLSIHIFNRALTFFLRKRS